VALLRVLETGEIRGVGSSNTYKAKCRVIAATNANLAQLAESGKFRQDLIFRLERLLIHLPPLRERTDDILQLSRYFLDVGRKVGTHAALSEDLKKTLKKYDWPGNVRELKNIIERMRLMHSDKLFYNINDLDIKFQIPMPAPQITTSNKPVKSASNELIEATLSPNPEPTYLSDSHIESILIGGRSPLRRQDRLRELFTKYKKLTRSEIIRILAISPNTATKDLKVLCNENFIKRIEPSASTRSHYFVKV
jgi:DNA-binding NtrC family response regulator